MAADDDYDIVLYKKNGRDPVPDVDEDDDTGNSDGADETVQIVEPPIGEYVLRVNNFDADKPWSGSIDEHKAGTFEILAGGPEAWTMTCESPSGRILGAAQGRGRRGATKDVGSICGAAANRSDTTGGGSGAGQANRAADPDCTPTSGFRTVTVRGSGRRALLGFTRAQRRPVTVDVFQQSIGRRVIGERLVARYANRSAGFTWDGKANRPGRTVTDGYYFVRYRMALRGGRVDVRRTTLRRVGGRFSLRPSFYRRDTCGILRSYKLTRPVFGGRTNREVGVAYRLNRAARVSVTVTRGTKVVKRFAAVQRAAGRRSGCGWTARRWAAGTTRSS
jgi:hypothetical protein